MSTLTSNDPYTRFAHWFDEARRGEPVNPDAACLATATADGRPAARMVLVKAVDQHGFVFYTNTASRKADELHGNPQAALCFYWRSIGRQVRVEGAVEAVTDAAADAYFATRDRTSQIGAWSSQQSRDLPSRATLENGVATHEARFGDGVVPRPPFWLGYRVMPREIEFWTQGAGRLHDRLVFTRDGADGWTTRRLYP